MVEASLTGKDQATSGAAERRDQVTTLASTGIGEVEGQCKVGAFVGLGWRWLHESTLQCWVELLVVSEVGSEIGSVREGARQLIEFSLGW